MEKVELKKPEIVKHLPDAGRLSIPDLHGKHKLEAERISVRDKDKLHSYDLDQ